VSSTHDLPLESQVGRARVRIQAVCDVDMIVPRSRATIRNRAEPVRAAVESAWDFVFDLGLSLRGDSAREERLRRRLEERPDDPEAAAELGGLLLKRQDYADTPQRSASSRSAAEAGGCGRAQPTHSGHQTTFRPGYRGRTVSLEKRSRR
jgi:hypothetical protein